MRNGMWVTGGGALHFSCRNLKNVYKQMEGY